MFLLEQSSINLSSKNVCISWQFIIPSSVQPLHCVSYSVMAFLIALLLDYCSLHFIKSTLELKVKFNLFLYVYTKALLGFPRRLSGKESACQAGDMGQEYPWIRISPEEGSDNPLQYSCLGKPMDRGACWAIVHGVAKSQTQFSN